MSKPIRSKAIRDSACGEICTLQISSVCRHDTETTVLAHLPDETHGIGQKSDDICACYACSACHDVIDRRRSWPVVDCSQETQADYRDFYMRRAMVRTMRRLIEKGIVVIK